MGPAARRCGFTARQAYTRAEGFTRCTELLLVPRWNIWKAGAEVSCLAFLARAQRGQRGVSRRAEAPT